MSVLKIVQTKSLIGSLSSHQVTIRTLGLRKISHEIYQTDTPQMRGMLHQIGHLIQWELVDVKPVETRVKTKGYKVIKGSISGKKPVVKKAKTTKVEPKAEMVKAKKETDVKAPQKKVTVSDNKTIKSKSKQKITTKAEKTADTKVTKTATKKPVSTKKSTKTETITKKAVKKTSTTAKKDKTNE